MKSQLKLALSTFVIAFIANVATANFAKAAIIELPQLNLQQVYDFQFGVATPFAHLVSMQIGSVTLAADIAAKNPLTNKKTNIIGGISAFSWRTGMKDPMKFTFHVSEANRKRLLEILKKPAPNQVITFNYQIFAYDPDAKDFFITLKSFTFPQRGIMNRIGKDMPSMKAVSMPLKGTLQKISDQVFVVSNTPDANVKTPANYAVQVSIFPPDNKQQQIVQGLSATENKKFNWGIIEK